MNLSEFEKLTFKQKGLIVFEKGKFIGTREYYNQRLVLYDLGDFFAEVWYNPNSNTIGRIETVRQDDNRINLYIKSNQNE